MAVRTEPFLANILPASRHQVLKTFHFTPARRSNGVVRYLLIFRAKARRSALPREAICEPGELVRVRFPLNPTTRCLRSRSSRGSAASLSPTRRRSFAPTAKPRCSYNPAVLSTLIPPFRLRGQRLSWVSTSAFDLTHPVSRERERESGCASEGGREGRRGTRDEARDPRPRAASSSASHGVRAGLGKLFLLG